MVVTVRVQVMIDRRVAASAMRKPTVCGPGNLDFPWSNPPQLVLAALDDRGIPEGDSW
jgi:hypothetical protein